jgi:hypothetical protein
MKLMLSLIFVLFHNLIYIFIIDSQYTFSIIHIYSYGSATSLFFNLFKAKQPPEQRYIICLKMGLVHI